MFNFLKSLFNFRVKKVSFSNSCESKQEAKRRDYLKCNLAQNEFYFWDKTDISNKKEINKRKKFLKYYQYIDSIILPFPTLLEIGNIAKEKYTLNKDENIRLLISCLHNGLPQYYTKKNLNKLRECRFYEAEIELLFGLSEQAIKAFMDVLYIDLLGDYCELYDDKKYSKQELKNDGFKEWSEGFIAPKIFKSVFKNNKTFQSLKEQFVNNAHSLSNNFDFVPPKSPEQVWEILQKYNIKSQKE